MKPHLFVAVLLLFITATAFAISSQEALDVVSRSNNFLVSGEQAEIMPNVKISDNRADYWVVAVLQDNSVVFFIPVNNKDSTIAEGTLVIRSLTKTAYILRQFNLLKQNLIKSQQWVVSSVDSKFFNDLANDLKDEEFQLETVRNKLEDYASLRIEISSLKSQLNSLEEAANSISSKLLKAIEYESDFFQEPDTNELSLLRTRFNDALAEIILFDADRAEYAGDIDKLKQGIAQTELDTETIKSFNELVSLPYRLQRITSLAASATALKQQLDSMFETASGRASTFTENLATRIERNSAYNELYGFNDPVAKETQNKYTSTSEIASVLLSQEYRYDWVEQAELVELEGNWKKAESYFKSNRYDLAIEFAKKSQGNAVKVYSGGFKQREEEGINIDLVITGVVGIIIVLIAIIIVRNRKKLASLVSEKTEDVDVYGMDEEL